MSLRAQVDELLGGLVDEAEEPLSRESWRLTTGDFGPHNMLFALNGQLTLVDFEAAGWDDPAHAVMSFVAHAASEDLPPLLSTLFLGEFAELAQLSAADTARYERVGQLMDLEWVAIYASALSADNIANKRRRASPLRPSRWAATSRNEAAREPYTLPVISGW